ncbi:hypothetical protein Q5O14_02370 [Eubacteriaceae bacterium ES2]|nr:hypothetical protein Q5O14_02370 [Eubacteriaceae bacterium ES2]
MAVCDFPDPVAGSAAAIATSMAAASKSGIIGNLKLVSDEDYREKHVAVSLARYQECQLLKEKITEAVFSPQ